MMQSGSHPFATARGKDARRQWKFRFVVAKECPRKNCMRSLTWQRPSIPSAPSLDVHASLTLDLDWYTWFMLIYSTTRLICLLKFYIISVRVVFEFCNAVNLKYNIQKIYYQVVLIENIKDESYY